MNRSIRFTNEEIQHAKTGLKTQLRRVVRTRTPHNSYSVFTNNGDKVAFCCIPPVIKYNEETKKFERHQKAGPIVWREPIDYGTVGDRLWVEEVWSPDHADFPLVYRSDGEIETNEGGMVLNPKTNRFYQFKWRSPKVMGSGRSRFHYEITNIRAERLHTATPQDFAADIGDIPYEEYWNRNNPDYPWFSNPWVIRIKLQQIPLDTIAEELLEASSATFSFDDFEPVNDGGSYRC